MGKEILDDSWWSIEHAIGLANSNKEVELSDAGKERIQACRSFLDKEINADSKPVYGINTGFGSLCNTSIAAESLEELQYNLVRSHACGTGDHVPDEIARLMLLLKAKGLQYGHSGVSISTVQRLLDLFNNGAVPEVFEQGSLGASGDLAPLAHLSLTLIGEGKLKKDGEWISSESYYNKHGLEPLPLKSKEGLALLNGTQFMSSYGVYIGAHGRKLYHWANLIGCLSLEGFDGRDNPYDARIHDVRGHEGQKYTAHEIREILKGSDLINQEKVNVQDPYSFRCMPQVHGASYDSIHHIISVVEREINSVTDNPTIFPEDGDIISAGNFHGQPLALVLDFSAIALAELASISERRTYKLISGTRGLPAFLVANPGLNSGFMIPQYTAASIVSQNKQLCTPASVDTIDSSNGQEDHVSMGANAATKAYKVLKNTERVLAIELLNAAQAIEFRRPGKSSPVLERLVAAFREKVSFMESDRILHNDIQDSLEFIQNHHPDEFR